jgi:hypothetical protein
MKTIYAFAAAVVLIPAAWALQGPVADRVLVLAFQQPTKEASVLEAPPRDAHESTGPASHDSDAKADHDPGIVDDVPVGASPGDIDVPAPRKPPKPPKPSGAHCCE